MRHGPEDSCCQRRFDKGNSVTPLNSFHGLLDTTRILLSREQVLRLPGYSTGLEIPESQEEICAHLFHPSESSFLDPPDQATHWTDTCRSDPGNTGSILEREAFVSLTSTGAESFIFSLSKAS